MIIIIHKQREGNIPKESFQSSVLIEHHLTWLDLMQNEKQKFNLSTWLWMKWVRNEMSVDLISNSQIDGILEFVCTFVICCSFNLWWHQYTCNVWVSTFSDKTMPSKWSVRIFGPIWGPNGIVMVSSPLLHRYRDRTGISILIWNLYITVYRISSFSSHIGVQA